MRNVCFNCGGGQRLYDKEMRKRLEATASGLLFA